MAMHYAVSYTQTFHEKAAQATAHGHISCELLNISVPVKYSAVYRLLYPTVQSPCGPLHSARGIAHPCGTCSCRTEHVQMLDEGRPFLSPRGPYCVHIRTHTNTHTYASAILSPHAMPQHTPAPLDSTAVRHACVHICIYIYHLPHEQLRRRLPTIPQSTSPGLT